MVPDCDGIYMVYMAEGNRTIFEHENQMENGIINNAID